MRRDGPTAPKGAPAVDHRGHRDAPACRAYQRLNEAMPRGVEGERVYLEMDGPLRISNRIEHSRKCMSASVEDRDGVPRLRVVHNLFVGFRFGEHANKQLSGPHGPYPDRSKRVDSIHSTGYTANVAETGFRMEFRIAAEELKRALYRAQGIVERKTTMPILANVLINATKAGVQVTAFDLDIGIVSEHSGEVLKPGGVTVSAKYLFDIVQSAPEPQVTLKKLPNNYVDITSGSAHFKIVGTAPEEYPKLPKEESAPLIKLNGATLLEMIRRTSFAISSDETRYILNGVFFEPREDSKIRMVATDGHRLAFVERELAGDFKLKGGVIIPRKGLFELKRLLDEAPEAECQLGFAENSAIFKKPGLTMVMRLIDGQFPEYQRVIPQESVRTVLLPRGKFLDALRRISLLSVDKSNAVKVALSENLIRITSSNPDLGEAKDDLEVNYKGNEITIGFNARYLIDVLSVLEGDQVAFELGDEHSPGVLHLPGERSYIAVVMPMRV